MRHRTAARMSLAAAQLCLVSACAQRHGPRDPGTRSVDAGEMYEDASEGAELGCGNMRDNDCADDSFCYGDLACGSVWECSPNAGPGPKPPACSAAEPFVVCGCDGYVQVRGAGCPHDRYAAELALQVYELGRARLTEAGRVRCDPTRTDPLAITYRVRARGFEAYEGKKVYWFVAGPRSDAEFGGMQVASISAGGFEGTLGPLGPFVRGPRPNGIHFFVDLDGDARCDEDPDPTTPWIEPGGEPAGDGRLSDFDLVEAFYAYTLEPPARVEPGFCNRFGALP